MTRTFLAMMIAGFFLHCNSALAQISHSVTLTWGASTTPYVAYNVYRSNTSGAYNTTPLASVSATSYTDSTVQAGQIYFYVVKAVDATHPNNLSAPSNEAMAVIPASSGTAPQPLSHANIIWQQDGTNVPSVWYMGGTGGSTVLSTKFLSISVTQPGWRIVAAGDLNGDGHPDLIWQQDGSNVPCVWYMGGSDGSTVLSSKFLSVTVPQPGWRIVAAADLNGDGHPDLIWQQDGSNVPCVWYMGGADGSTVLSTKFLSVTVPQPGWRIVAAADLNGDGHPDLIWQQDVSNVPSVWYMGGSDGSTLLSTILLSGPQPGWRIVGPK
ncbi:MAG TPA: FG-GAP-like repeat-containing protein [Terriglobales bacterium]|nr:FG-GAP-like repeat-containing protein [Terriglobales bacterium]